MVRPSVRTVDHDQALAGATSYGQGLCKGGCTRPGPLARAIANCQAIGAAARGQPARGGACPGSAHGQPVEGQHRLRARRPLAREVLLMGTATAGNDTVRARARVRVSFR
ncbi:hypothetical protein BHE74_00027381 [Ensete ventricosum]|nr:hypothetical protein GW17_00048391 [Ensete ventricosum]RWW65313.1 hypothetical protein BHE74_00027381 [Ensete ventricosum]